MSFTIVWLPAAMSAYRRLRTVDPIGAKLVSSTVAALATDQYPRDSHRLGGAGMVRLFIGDYRVLYEVDGETVTVYVINVGSVPPPRR